MLETPSNRVEIGRDTPAAMSQNNNYVNKETNMLNLELLRHADAKTLALVDLDLQTGGTEDSARALLMEAKGRIGTVNYQTEEGDKSVEKDEYADLLSDPPEVDGLIKFRVTEAEFDQLRLEVGEKFFKERVCYDGRDIGAHKMLKELKRRGENGFSLSYKNSSEQPAIPAGVQLANKFQARPGRKLLRK